MPLPNRKTARARGFALADEVGPRMPPQSFLFCFFTKIEHFCFIKAPRTPGVKFPVNRKVKDKIMAGRPRKAEAEKSKQREVWITDCRWEEIRKEAKAAGMTISAYLRQRRSDRPISARQGLLIIETLQGIRDRQDHLVDVIERNGGNAEVLQALLRLEGAYDRVVDGLVFR